MTNTSSWARQRAPVASRCGFRSASKETRRLRRNRYSASVCSVRARFREPDVWRLLQRLHHVIAPRVEPGISQITGGHFVAQGTARTHHVGTPTPHRQPPSKGEASFRSRPIRRCKRFIRKNRDVPDHEAPGGPPAAAAAAGPPAADAAGAAQGAARDGQPGGAGGRQGRGGGGPALPSAYIAFALPQ